MNESNLQIWDKVSKTDPSATKTSTQGGRNQTSIDGYWMIREATKLFGPLGIGWGYEVLDERWDDGALIPVKIDESNSRLEQSKTHTIKLKLWYMQSEQRGEIIQYGHTQAIYKSKWGVSDDGEAPKKSLMDAIKKSLSMLGFCSDVFMGQFDIAEYREQLEIEQGIAKAEDREKEIETKRAELIDYVKRNLDTLMASKSPNEAKKIANAVLRDLERKKAIASLRDIAERGIKQIAIESAKFTTPKDAKTDE